MKWIKYLGVIIAVVFVAGIVLHFSIQYVAKQAIISSVSEATGVAASVESVQIGVVGGRFQMDGFVLSNPRPTKFDSRQFLYLRRTQASVELSSLFHDVIEIPTVHLEGLSINLERNNGRENYRIIQSNLKTTVGGGQTPVEDAQAYVIRELLISDIEVTFSGYPGMNRTLKLADIRLTNVGEKDQSVTRSEITGIIIREVYRQLLQSPNLIPGVAVEGIREGMKGLGGLMDTGVQFLGDITNESGKVLGTVGDSAGEAAKGVGDFLKGVFGGDE